MQKKAVVLAVAAMMSSGAFAQVTSDPDGVGPILPGTVLTTTGPAGNDLNVPGVMSAGIVYTNGAMLANAPGGTTAVTALGVSVDVGGGAPETSITATGVKTVGNVTSDFKVAQDATSLSR